MNLEKLSKEELVKLQADVDKAIKSLESRRRTDALKAAQAAAKEHGFTLDQLTTSAKVSGVLSAKYCNPDDPEQTWSGRGRKPRWFVSALESGKTADEMEI